MGKFNIDGTGYNNEGNEKKGNTATSFNVLLKTFNAIFANSGTVNL